ncbi:PAS domain-containing protein [Ferviditalea candida]|uniref:histidine kinase n=1 Tax=Ferviditalea candida TaxID=3108399 RepID=A0ABU5ZME5_9BACL|nr:PAS domain-containing protein [Paenibacillaceae bacterium T2]
MDRDLEIVKARDLLRETISRLDAVLWARDFETRRLLYMSEGAGKVFGVTREEAARMSSFAHIVHPEDAAAVAETIYSGNPEMVEFRIVHPISGEIRWIQTNIRPEADETGRIRVVHGISIDVTNRKLPEEFMKAQNEVLKLIALGKPLSEVLGKIAEQTNLNMPGRVCSILLVDTEQRMFMQGASPGFPDIYHKTMLSKSIDGLKSPEAMAVKGKKPVVLSDIGGEATDEMPTFAQVACAFGLKSAYVWPIFSVIGMLSPLLRSIPNSAGNRQEMKGKWSRPLPA